MVPNDYTLYEEPRKGDLVFFQRQPGKATGRLVSEFDWHNDWMDVSHVGIVVDVSQSTDVIENTLHPDGVHSGTLHLACHPPRNVERHLLVVPNPWGDKVDAVLRHAKEMLLPNSDYSGHQLALAGLAALARKMPCASPRRKELWEHAHHSSRHLVKEVERIHGTKYFSGTCAGMVAEAARRAGFDRRVKEPPCLQDIDTAETVRLDVLTTVLDLGAVAWDLGHNFVAELREAMRSLPSRDELNAELERADDERGGELLVTDPDGQVSFESQAALHLVKELHRLHMVPAGVEHVMHSALHVTFTTLNHLLHPKHVHGHPPQPGKDPVDPALMSLGLMLERLGCDGKTYTFS